MQHHWPETYFFLKYNHAVRRIQLFNQTQTQTASKFQFHAELNLAGLYNATFYTSARLL